MVPGIVTACVVTYPLSIRMNVGRVGMPGLIAEIAGLLLLIPLAPHCRLPLPFIPHGWLRLPLIPRGRLLAALLSLRSGSVASSGRRAMLRNRLSMTLVAAFMASFLLRKAWCRGYQ